MTELEQLNAQRKQLEEHIAAAEAAKRLEQNPDFKALILNGFMRDEVVRNCAISADPALDVNQRGDALAMAQAGGHLQRFLSARVQFGYLAKREIEDVDNMILELQNEEDLSNSTVA